MQEGVPSRSRLGRLLDPRGYGPRRLVLQGLLCLALATLVVDRLAHALFWPAADSREVVLISSERCPHSRAVRARLQAAGVPFREIEGRRDALPAALAAWAFQSLRVPIVIVGPEVIHGHRPERIDAALAAIGHAPPAAADRADRADRAGAPAAREWAVRIEDGARGDPRD